MRHKSRELFCVFYPSSVLNFLRATSSALRSPFSGKRTAKSFQLISSAKGRTKLSEIITGIAPDDNTSINLYECCPCPARTRLNSNAIANQNTVLKSNRFLYACTLYHWCNLAHQHNEPISAAFSLYYEVPFWPLPNRGATLSLEREKVLALTHYS